MTVICTVKVRRINRQRLRNYDHLCLRINDRLNSYNSKLDRGNQVILDWGSTFHRVTCSMVGESKDLDRSHLTEVPTLSHPFASQVARLSGLQFAGKSYRTNIVENLDVPGI